MENTDSEALIEPRSQRKDLVAFWIFGLCNNYGYVVMLTAALDIIKENTVRLECFKQEFLFTLSFNLQQFSEASSEATGRNCHKMSTGAVLLADIIPSFIIKMLSPFLSYNPTYRVTIACVIAVISFVAVAFASSTSAVIFGVALTSFAAGLGEPTFLAHSTHYHNNCVSTWSSGTGGAGIIGALSYSLLRETGLSSRQTLLVMIMVPMIEIFTFIFILTTPRVTATEQEENGDERSALIESLEDTPPPTMTLSEKLRYIPRLMIFVIPLCLVYFFEYFVNQGLVSAIMMNESLEVLMKFLVFSSN